jgi:hypothetical protein
MGESDLKKRRFTFVLISIFAVVLGNHSGQAQPETQAQPQPPTLPLWLPRNLIAPSVPYERGIASIRARDSARPQAVQPKRPSDAAPVAVPRRAEEPGDPSSPAPDTPLPP